MSQALAVPRPSEDESTSPPSSAQFMDVARKTTNGRDRWRPSCTFSNEAQLMTDIAKFAISRASRSYLVDADDVGSIILQLVETCRTAGHLRGRDALNSAQTVWVSVWDDREIVSCNNLPGFRTGCAGGWHGQRASGDSRVRAPFRSHEQIPHVKRTVTSDEVQKTIY